MGLIWLEFEGCVDKIVVAMGETIISAMTSNKPKLLDQRVKASLTRQEC